MMYMFEGFENGKFVYRAYSYPTLKTVRADAKQWANEKSHRIANILKELPRQPGHNYGSEWQHVEVVGSSKKDAS